MKKKSPQEGWGLNPRPLGPTSKPSMATLSTNVICYLTNTKKHFGVQLAVCFKPKNKQKRSLATNWSSRS
jgi:hypothetical protein